VITPKSQAFDELLLIKRGGRTIFFGETGHYSANLINYFEVRCRPVTHQTDVAHRAPLDGRTHSRLRTRS
jgi:hypothetical protein